MFRIALTFVCLLFASLLQGAPKDSPKTDRVWAPSATDKVLKISGTYPHLTVYNPSGECGIGAVLPWADKLWFLTYPPHHPEGGEDKLYGLDKDLKLAIHPASVGGTHAGRMIHRESDQAIVGPYFIDSKGNVRAADIHKLKARLTAVMRHLEDPARMVYFFGMERELYEVDVRSLAVKQIYAAGPYPGTHGKGAYASHGRLVIANNGERGWRNAKDPKFDGPAGVLAESTGHDWKAPWNIVERKTFTEVTGPGGLYGNSADDDRLWTTGWDKRSVILKLLEANRWHTYRLPKASYSHDALHGWYTEWPRIRELKPGLMLMHMHGLFYHFPKTFSAGNTAGLRPISSYLKMPVDYCWWNDQIVMARDDASIMENELAGQSHSALWFGQLSDLERYGSPAGWGGPWMDDDVSAGQASDPFLTSGFARGVIHLRHQAEGPVSFAIEADQQGSGRWTKVGSVQVPAKGYAHWPFPEGLKAAWLRITADRHAPKATAYFHLSNPPVEPQRSLFAALADADAKGPATSGLIKPAQGDARTLLFAANRLEDGRSTPAGLYQMDGSLELKRAEDQDRDARLREKFGAKAHYSVDRASAIVSQGPQRLRLPKGDPALDKPLASGPARGLRELVTERSMLNAHGTFYEMPRWDVGGMRRIRPVTTHNKQISDFCSWRGLLVLAGVSDKATPDGHCFRSSDGRVGLWMGNVDDLWRMGKPRGVGGPWKDASVEPGKPSDPYLMTGYDEKRLSLSHNSQEMVTFTVEVDFLADDTWSVYATYAVPPGKRLEHRFPAAYSAHWVRFKADRPCRATATLIYE